MDQDKPSEEELLRLERVQLTSKSLEAFWERCHCQPPVRVKLRFSWWETMLAVVKPLPRDLLEKGVVAKRAKMVLVSLTV